MTTERRGPTRVILLVVIVALVGIGIGVVAPRLLEESSAPAAPAPYVPPAPREPITNAGSVEGVFHDVTPERVRITWRLPSVESAQLLAYSDFDRLDALAHQLRTEKTRNEDGLWLLRSFYEGVATPKRPSDASWVALIGRLEEWQVAKPGSVTARIAAAQAWSHYGWFALGNGGPSERTREAWAAKRDRGQRAFAELEAARALPERCPDYYAGMHVAFTAAGWTHEVYDAMFDEAFASDPTYYDYAMSKVFLHQERWGGQPGEWEQVASELAGRIGGDDGEVLYARLVAHIWTHDPSILVQNQVRWERVKPAFDLLLGQQPKSKWFLNLYAILAVQAEDAETAGPLFERIADAPIMAVWGQQRWIDHTRDWLAGARGG